MESCVIHGDAGMERKPPLHPAILVGSVRFAFLFYGVHDMLSYPLTAVEARIHMKRAKNTTSRVVGSNGNFFVEERRVTKSKNGIEADVIVMHGKALGRHTHTPNVKRETVHPKPRIIA